MEQYVARADQSMESRNVRALSHAWGSEGIRSIGLNSAQKHFIFGVADDDGLSDLVDCESRRMMPLPAASSTNTLRFGAKGAKGAMLGETRHVDFKTARRSKANSKARYTE